MRGNLITVFLGGLIAIVSWVPLWIIEARDPYAMPFRLGLLTFAASLVGGIIALVGLTRLVMEAFRNRN
jgi:hypothetical protein